MNNTIRYIFAGVLIFLIILLQPIYLKWLGYDDSYDIDEQNIPAQIVPVSESAGKEKKFTASIASLTFFSYLFLSMDIQIIFYKSRLI